MAKGIISSNSSGNHHTSGHKTSGHRSCGYQASYCCWCGWGYYTNDYCSGDQGSGGHRSGGKCSGGNRSRGIDPERDFASDPDDDIE